MAKVGRPSTYVPAFAETAKKLCKLGATDRDLADFFGVTEKCINEWKFKHPEFGESLKVGKAEADARVEQSLYRRALGYSHDAVKIFADPKTGNQKIVEYVEHFPPDTTACIFWLKNRKPEEWRDRQQHEMTGKDGAPLVPAITITVGTEPSPAS